MLPKSKFHLDKSLVTTFSKTKSAKKRNLKVDGIFSQDWPSERAAKATTQQNLAGPDGILSSEQGESCKLVSSPPYGTRKLVFRRNRKERGLLSRVFHLDGFGMILVTTTTCFQGSNIPILVVTDYYRVPGAASFTQNQ